MEKVNEQAKAFKISDLQEKISSHGPYTKVFESKVQALPIRAVNETEMKYTSIIDVSTRKEKLYSQSYPSVIKLPKSLPSKVIIGSPPSSGKVTVTLSRPKSAKSGPRYSSSSTSYQTKSRSLIDPAQPLIPFLQMTNALKLYLKLEILQDNERIVFWIPGSYLKQPCPFIDEKQAFSIYKMLQKNDSSGLKEKNVSVIPGYLLLTNKFIYIVKPLFNLSSLKRPLRDEQTSYMDPSKYITIKERIPIFELSRIDVGPGRQYLVFHSDTRLPTSSGYPILSIVFQTRSKQSTTFIVDSITTLLHESSVNFNRAQIINQDVEWSIKNIQDNVLLPLGPKSVSILSYNNQFSPHKAPLKLSDKEYDSGVNEQISKVDFDFVKLYLFGVYLRYFKPVQSLDHFGVEIMHTTFLGTREYLYVLQERLDAWPPAVFPPEYSSRYPSFVKNFPLKGYLVDIIPQYTTIGVGRLNDITRIERWRSWRIDSALGKSQFIGLGHQLQNGHIGHFSTTRANEATASGWFWWIRVVFGGELNSNNLPITPPKQTPECDYWWDLVFSSRESADDFIEAIVNRRRNQIHVVVGDD